MDSRHQSGHVAEIKASLYYAELGYEIYWPSFTQSGCDFIIVKKDEMRRIQVKKAYWFTRPSGTRYLQATTRKGAGSAGYKTYTKEDCDIIFIVGEENLWSIPVEKLNGIQNVVLEKGQQVRKRGSKAYDMAQWKVV